MPETTALPSVLELLGIHPDDACPIAAFPPNAVPVEPMTPSGSDSSEENLDVEQTITKVSARRSGRSEMLGSPQKSEGKPIELESDVDMEPIPEDKALQSETITGAEAELLLTAVPTEETKVEPEAMPLVAARFTPCQEASPPKEAKEAEDAEASVPAEAFMKPKGAENTEVPAVATSLPTS